MNTYQYVAVGPRGDTQVGRQMAESEIALDRELEARGLCLTKAALVSSSRSARSRKLVHEDLISVTTQLAVVAGAGVHVVEGLEGIGARLERPASRAVIEDVVRSLRAGSMLSDAVDKHPRSFPSVYRASLRAAEVSGALDVVLGRVARYLEWTRGIRATTIQALIYPSILFCALSGLVLVLLYFVLPRIIGMFPGGREQLPSETRFVLAISDFLTGNWVALAVLAGAAFAGLTAMRRSERGREVFDRALLAIPKYGRVAQQIAISRFASTASVLQAAGCDVFTVLDVSGSTCGNAAITSAFARASQHVRRGQTITQALERESVVDPLLVQMVSIGEKTGELDMCLAKLVAYYDEEIPRTVKRFLSVLEPAMLLVAGFVVAVILLAALMPIFTLYETIG
jgi:type II secretory pathway component PulF